MPTKPKKRRYVSRKAKAAHKPSTAPTKRHRAAQAATTVPVSSGATPRKRGRPRVHTDTKIKKLADALDTWRMSDSNYILGKFALKHGIHAQRLSEFAQKSEYFAEALKRAKQHQENVLLEGALNGKLDRTMAIFALKNVAGWRDRQEQALQVNSIAGLFGEVAVYDKR